MNRKNHTTVLVIIDGGRHDYVRPDTMPFLDGLADTGARAALESPPGFAQNTVLFTGRYPDTSGRFSAFAYDPSSSPYRWTRCLGPLRSAILPHKAMVPARRTIDRVTKRLTGAHHPDPAWIPARHLPFFTPTENMLPASEPGALGAPSIFDLCRKHGLRYRYLAHPVCPDDETVQDTLVREIRARAPTDLFVARFTVAGEEGHAHGPSSDAMGAVLHRLDDRLASIHAALEAAYDSWDLVICGNHGMGPVKQKVDVLDALDAADARPGKDYVVFVHSTMAAFWYRTEKGRAAVERVLPTIPGSRVIDDEERRARRIPTGPRWGDRILAADPGVMFWPDYFHVRDAKVQGVHGHLDKQEEGHAMGILVSHPGERPHMDLGTRPLVDVFPTLCGLLGVPAPAAQEGRPLRADLELVVEH